MLSNVECYNTFGQFAQEVDNNTSTRSISDYPKVLKYSRIFFLG